MSNLDDISQPASPAPEPRSSNPLRRLIRYTNDHPWIYVVLAFAILIAAWTTLIVIAVNNRQPPLPE